MVVGEVAETAPATDQVASAWAASSGGSSTPAGRQSTRAGGQAEMPLPVSTLALNMPMPPATTGLGMPRHLHRPRVQVGDDVGDDDRRPGGQADLGHDVLRDLVDEALHHLLGQGHHAVPQGDKEVADGRRRAAARGRRELSGR